jgi:protein-arginine kinase
VNHWLLILSSTPSESLSKIGTALACSVMAHVPEASILRSIRLMATTAATITAGMDAPASSAPRRLA